LTACPIPERVSVIVVVGGGVVGVCSTYYLAQRGLGVTLVEKGDIAAGSSYGNGVSLGPVTGALVAQLAAGEAPMLDLGPLRPERFP
jgi:glycine/D-amino acid oxidase-like deaminating enzyme